MNQICYANQIERLNLIRSTIQQISALPDATLLQRPVSGGWSVVETVEHMNRAYAPHYRSHLDRQLQASPASEQAADSFKSGWVARFLHRAMRPQEGQRKMKMKTLKKFQPTSDQCQDVEAVFTRFFEHQESLKQHVLRARNKDVSGKKIPSAIGSLIQFTIPECFEFVIAHEERHVLQCQEILSVIQSDSIGVIG